MSEHPILTILLLLAFVVEVFGSIEDLMLNSLFQSFIIMLVAIFVLFVAYAYLNDLLTESLKASK